MSLTRRGWMQLGGASLLAPLSAGAAPDGTKPAPLKITGLKVTPVALPDPPLLAASGCHGPYFLRNVVQLETDAGIVGLGETRGGVRVTGALERAGKLLLGQNAFAHRAFMGRVNEVNPACAGGIELACLDACARATKRRLCELLGGPVQEEVEFAAYLFYRYAADHPVLLADKRLVDGRGKGDRALDDWGEVRTPAAMVKAALRFQKQWGFRVFKLKGGVLSPDAEWETMQGMHAELGKKALLRIDPNARWTQETSVRIGKKLRDLPLEYYEDPCRGQEGMAAVRKATGLVMSTNMCVTRFEHIVPAIKQQPIDVVLADHHYWGGLLACQELGRICATVGWKMSQHSNNHAGITMAAMIHLAASTPQLTLASDTHYPWLPEKTDLIQGGKLPIKGGKMKVPDGPGLGVALDADALARAHETYRKCGMKDRDDATTMRMVEPGWKRSPL